VVEAALRAALESSAMRDAARRLSAEVAAMPEQEVVAMQLELGGVKAVNR
jgi:hypothetical protein